MKGNYISVPSLGHRIEGPSKHIKPENLTQSNLKVKPNDYHILQMSIKQHISDQINDYSKN